MKKIKVAILGATGYAGSELFRLLYNHPFSEIVGVSSVSFENKNLNDVYKNFINLDEYLLINQDDAIKEADVVFAALPHGLSEELALKCKSLNKKLIDLGADFRFTEEDNYKEWYGNSYLDKSIHKDSIYGLPELNRNIISEKSIIGNPGCYPTSISLGLYPLLNNKLISLSGIISDSKSGVSGAGRGLSQNTHFPECHEAFAPYKLASHRHVPEIEETLSKMAGEKITITFVPHLLPVNRGILSTIYCDKKTDLSLEELHDMYLYFYKDEFFVRVMPLGVVCNIRNVTYSNFCDISLHEDKTNNKIIIVTAIDNMIKGAAGQAIQNMNIMFGIDEKTGLDFLPSGF